MSKRLGFTDRATIAENKDILRFNERLEREAKGLPADEPRRSVDRRRGPSEGRRPDRPARTPRPPRPSALDEDQRAMLQAALDAAVGETGLEEAGRAVITRLDEHDSFDKACGAGWTIAAGGHATERTPAEWDLLRQVWLSIRLALLEAYVAIKPELEPTLTRERKQVARINRAATPQRRRRGKRPPSGGRVDGRPGPPRSGPPSPADVARRIAKPGNAAGGDEGAATDAVEGFETSDSTETAAEAVEPVADLPEPDQDERQAVAAELRAEHGTARAEDGDEVGEDQLKLDI